MGTREDAEEERKTRRIEHKLEMARRRIKQDKDGALLAIVPFKTTGKYIPAGVHKNVT